MTTLRILCLKKPFWLVYVQLFLSKNAEMTASSSCRWYVQIAKSNFWQFWNKFLHPANACRSAPSISIFRNRCSSVWLLKKSSRVCSLEELWSLTYFWTIVTLSCHGSKVALMASSHCSCHFFNAVEVMVRWTPVLFHAQSPVIFLNFPGRSALSEIEPFLFFLNIV